MRPPVVIMGVSGSGKSTVGTLLATQLGTVFVDADDLHSADARATMAAGIPLTDEDRRPWLKRVGLRMAEPARRGHGIVVACSALRRSYRDVLRAAAGAPIAFVHLSGSEAVLRERMVSRRDHFMPPHLLPSQLATLEPLEVDELGIAVDAAAEPSRIVRATLDWIAGMTL